MRNCIEIAIRKKTKNPNFNNFTSDYLKFDVKFNI